MAAGVLQHAAPAADVQRDHPHRLADRDHREAGLLGRPARRCGAGCRSRRSGSRGPAPAARRPAGSGCRRWSSTTAPSILHSSRSRVAGTRRRARSRRCTAISTVLSKPSTISAAGVAAQDPLQAVAQLGARGDGSAERRSRCRLPVSSGPLECRGSVVGCRLLWPPLGRPESRRPDRRLRPARRDSVASSAQCRRRAGPGPATCTSTGGQLVRGSARSASPMSETSTTRMPRRASLARSPAARARA